MNPARVSSEARRPPDSSPSSPSPSGYKGVRKRKWGKWVSEIRLPNSRERIWLGSYDSAEKAARAFDAALFCLRGRSAKFNFPHSPPRISGAQSLSHQEIQAAAAQYASQHHPGPEEDGGEVASSADEATALQCTGEQSMDWSILETLEENERMVSDFGFMYSDMDYIRSGDCQLHPPPAMDRTNMKDGDDEDDDVHDHGNNGGDYVMHGTSFLWNF
ncbi:hypothetical protein SAY86_002637 [Trapa natans]|uniref:AP2/ERF domain-containing protein n=1 Tax=Trapa natans TaxID=22666 RepID=A0AAN7LQR8_TRANT|nr:hypothetical protein SAY86_002637 [Trapa natans]